MGLVSLMVLEILIVLEIQTVLEIHMVLEILMILEIQMVLEIQKTQLKLVNQQNLHNFGLQFTKSEVKYSRLKNKITKQKKLKRSYNLKESFCNDSRFNDGRKEI